MNARSLIYQYCGPDAGLCILNDLKLKVTPPIEFNDPFEFMPRMDHAMDRTTFERWLLDPDGIAQATAMCGPPPEGLAQIQERIRTHPELIHQLFSRIYPDMCRKRVRENCRDFSTDYGVICFSRVRTSILMWAHYAAKHSGIAIGFDLPNAWSAKLLEVLYSSERVPFDPTQPIGGEHTDEFSRQMISTKHADWGYEEEVRLLVKLSQLDPPSVGAEGKPLYLMKIRPEQIKAISLGLRCSDKTEEAVREAVQINNLAVAVDRAVPHDHNFAVSFESVPHR